MLLVLLLLGATSQVDVELSLSDGTVQAGKLETLAAERVVIVRPEGSHEFGWNNLRQIRFQDSAIPTALQQAMLTDGTRLVVSGFQSAGEQVRLQGPSGSTAWELPRSQLRAVRLLALDGELEEFWRGVVQSGPKSDVVVIRRADHRLQSIEGVLGEVDESTVKFQFDGDWIEVRRARVAGIVYAVPNQVQQGTPIGQIVLTDSSELQARQVELRDDHLSVVTLNGSQFTIPLERVHHVDFAATSTVYLSDLEPESTMMRPYVLVPVLSDANRRWYEPQRDRRLSREPLVATVEGNERSFSKGLSLHSHTELVYRLAGRFHRFLAWGAVDDADGQGDLEIIILADGREVYRQAFRAGEEARPIDVDMSGVNRMQIVVDYGARGDVGDQISLHDARFIK